MSTATALDWQATDIGYLPTTQPGLRTLIVGAGEAGRSFASSSRVDRPEEAATLIVSTS